MILTDVNILIYAFRKDTENHSEYREWLHRILNGSSQFGMSEMVLSSFIRICTHPKIFKNPCTIDEVFSFTDTIRNRPNCTIIFPKERHWEIFRNLCKENNVKGNLVPDAYFAALAIEWGCEWISTDRDFTRFKGLNWRHPLDQ